MTQIHPTALVDPGAQIASDVKIGAYSVIGGHVRIGSGSVIDHHVVLDGHTTIGCDNHIASFCSLGGPPQDKKYAGEATLLTIGDRNVIREYSFFNLGTVQGGGITRIGNDNWIMAYAHIAHDCQVGDHTIFANNAQIAGHVEIADWVILGGFTIVHQFVKIGIHAMTSMGSAIYQDVPPFVIVAGNRAAPHGLNSEGLRRRGFTPAILAALRQAYKTIYRSGLSAHEACTQLLQAAQSTPEAAPQLDCLREFIQSATRGIVR